MTSLQVKWNLKLNKRKSEILTAEKIEEINGVKCSTSVKYLGVRVAVDKKDQIRTAGLWRRQDIDRIEAGIYRKILGEPNTISNKVILNTMTSIRLAGDAISHLSKGVWDQF
jgi:ERCC4-type nuclease